jgi:phosphate transport system permease protein
MSGNSDWRNKSSRALEGESNAPQAAVRPQNLTWTLASYGEPVLWLTGGALAVATAMIVGLLGYIAYQGMVAFWPGRVIELRLYDGRVLWGEVARVERYIPGPDVLEGLPESVRDKARRFVEGAGTVRRRLVRVGNFELTGEHFRWVSDFEVEAGGEDQPEWVLVLERQAWGRFYGRPKAFLVDGQHVAEGPEEVWTHFCRWHPEALRLWRKIRDLERYTLGRISHRMEAERLRVRNAELRYGPDSPQMVAALQRWKEKQSLLEEESAQVARQIEELRTQLGRWGLLLVTSDGQEVPIFLGDIVRAYPANKLNWQGQVAVYLARIWEFLTDEPREANSEGGVFPAIFGTVLMTLLMALGVAPFGVVAAIYLREYARAGFLVSAVRIAVNNLAGVPSIVFGVFGLGFFCYTVGTTIDQLFFAARLPTPTYGSGGILWASLTLALLTLPVVVVATEEALAAVPNSMREGSYACGATKWQTIRRVVLPRAMPGILTGMILAMARGAGEVAPLMLVGAVKLAPELPIDGEFPFFHPERSFMHLGFHIYDLGFQSQNAEAARPMVFATALLLILIVFALNLTAIVIRSRLRRRLLGSQF